MSGATDAAAACPICSAPVVRQVPVHPAHGATPSAIAVCDACGHGLLVPEPTDAELAAAYARAYGTEGQKFRAGLEHILRALATLEARALRTALPTHSPGVLDVGSGRGVLANALAAAGVPVTAVERSRDAAAALDPRVTLVVNDNLEEVDLPERAFGAVVFRHVLEHMRRPAAALRKAHSLLAEGGLLLVEVPNFASLQSRAVGAGWLHLDPPRHLHHFSPQSLTRAVADAGFAVESMRCGSAVHDLMGWVSGALARAGRQPRGLYEGLHAGAPLPVVDSALGAAVAPVSLALTLITRTFGDAAAVALRARRVASDHAAGHAAGLRGAHD